MRLAPRPRRAGCRRPISAQCRSAALPSYRGRKGHVLVGLAEGRRALIRGAQPVLVEGPLDAIAVSIATPGHYTGVTPCGTALTGEQVVALARTVSLPDRGLLVAFDNDDAGRKAAARAYAHLVPVTGGINAAILPEGADPAGVLVSHGRQALAAMLTVGTSPLAGLAVDSAIENWARGRDLIFAELQMGALRAAATVIATLHQDDIGTQASRICQLWMNQYGWQPSEVNREIIDAIDRHHNVGAPPVPHAPWTVWSAVRRATAPPRQQPAASGTARIASRAPQCPARATSSERE
jgi:DNA primase